MNEPEQTGCETATMVQLLEEVRRRCNAAVVYVNPRSVDPGMPQCMTLIYGDLLHLKGALDMMVIPRFKHEIETMIERTTTRGGM